MLGARATRFCQTLLQCLARSEDADARVVGRKTMRARKGTDGRLVHINGLQGLGIFGFE
jgi:hypothetical protein